MSLRAGPRIRPGRRPGAMPRPGRRGGAPRWLLPLLVVVLAAFAASAAWRWWGPGSDPGIPGTARPGLWARWTQPKGPPASARVEVLNGSGEPGAAAKLASYLREGGFNVVQVGSADRYDYARTLVVGRTEDPRPARAVAGYLGDVPRIRQRARSEADVTVIVGRDRGRLPWGEGREPKGRG